MKYSFPSTRPLASWLRNLKDRYEQLDGWTGDPLNIPKVRFCVSPVPVSRLKARFPWGSLGYGPDVTSV